MSNWKNPDPNRAPGSFVSEYPKWKFGAVTALRTNSIAIKYDHGGTAEVFFGGVGGRGRVRCRIS